MNSYWKSRGVLVTGGAGFIGSNLCDALVREGARVVVVDDLSVGKADNLAQARATGQLKLIHASILEPADWAEEIKDLSVVFHMAVVCLRRSFENPRWVHEVNATGTLVTLETCRTGMPNLERFVYVSSSEVYGTALTAPMTEEHPLKPTTVYGASKLAGEIYAQASGLPVTVARPFNTYGPREHHEGSSGEVIPRFAVRISNDLPPLIYGDGSQTRDFTQVADTARGLMLCASHPSGLGETWNLARGQEVSIARIAELLGENLGRPDLKPDFLPARPADVARHFACVEKARRDLGFEAGTSIEAGLKDFVTWFCATYPDPGHLLEEVKPQNW